MDSKLYTVVQTCAVVVGVAIVVALISGCSVYKSNGRKSFEDRAPGSIVNRNVGSGGSILSSDATCWTQPAQEPLWSIPENSMLTVQSLNAELLEVCLENQNPEATDSDN